jgi:hypothetical protein
VHSILRGLTLVLMSPLFGVVEVFNYGGDLDDFVERTSAKPNKGYTILRRGLTFYKRVRLTAQNSHGRIDCRQCFNFEIDNM